MIALIPARGGSKGVSGKNIKPLAGKPLIAHTIETAENAQNISEIFVSTDSEEIAEVAKSFGARVPFMRPTHLAADTSKAIDVYLYTIEKLNADLDLGINEFVVLQPTSPLRTSEDIDDAIAVFRKKNADSVISVTEASHPPVWAKKVESDGTLADYFSHICSTKNRQEINRAYMPNGAVFIFQYANLKKHYKYYLGKTYPYIMSADRSIDIDTLFDFEMAEYLLKRRADNNKGPTP